MHGIIVRAPQNSTIDEHNVHVRLLYTKFQRKTLTLRI